MGRVVRPSVYGPVSTTADLGWGVRAHRWATALAAVVVTAGRVACEPCAPPG
jgi:hypothetical protein